jgi:hypothetical protein
MAMVWPAPCYEIAGLAAGRATLDANGKGVVEALDQNALDPHGARAMCVTGPLRSLGTGFAGMP